MHIDEVINALKFGKESLETENILQLSQQLVAILSQHVQPNQPRNPFDDQLKALVSALNKISLSKLTNNERDVLDKYQAISLIGEAASTRIQSIFTQHAIDPATALKKMQEFQQEVQAFIETARQALAGLTPLIREREWDIEKGEEVLRITFQKDASILNIVQLKDHASAWNEIMRGFAMAAGTSPDAVKILSLREGSIILEVGALAGMVLAIGKAAKVILEGIEKYYVILQKSEEIKKLKLENATIASALAKEAESYADIQAEKIAATVLNECFPEKGDGELIEAVKRGVKRLFTFLKNGGGLDYQPFDEDSEESIQPQLEEVFTNIRAIENQISEIKYLVGPSDIESDDGTTGAE